MACETKTVLLAKYQQATHQYSEAVRTLNQRMEISSKEEFGRLYRLTEDARMNAANTMRDLEHHIADHDC
jgi:hypothetical protein